MRRVFIALTYLVTVLVAVQFFLAGRGAATAEFEAHRALGFVILLLGVATGVTAALGAVRGTARTLTGALVLLLALQPFIAGLGHGLLEDSTTNGGILFGLHAVNGVLVMAVLGGMLRAARNAETATPAAVPSRPAA